MRNILRNYSLTRKLFIGLALGTVLFLGENAVINAATEPTVFYRTAEEWSKRYAIEPYANTLIGICGYQNILSEIIKESMFTWIIPLRCWNRSFNIFADRWSLQKQQSSKM